MLRIIILHSLLKQNFQQANHISYILPKENQFLKGVISDLDEKISQTQMLGFGLWFKWQPEALQAINKFSKYFLFHYITENECLQQFIYSLVNYENKYIYILYFENNQSLEFQLKVWSDYFIFQEEIWFNDELEGVWMFFDSFFDFKQKFTTFYLYKSLTQELTQYKINEIPIIQDQLQYEIGKVCDQCAILNFVNCFTRFQGRISILFQRDNFEQSQYLTTIENMYTQVNDCVERNQKLIIGNQIFDEDFYIIKNLGIVEKLYFKISGWVKVFNNFQNNEFNQLLLFQIYKNYKENYPNFGSFIQIYYSTSMIYIGGYKDIQNKTIDFLGKLNFSASLMIQWHYIQFAVGYSNQTSSFKIYSNQLNEIITSNFLFRQSTGIQYGIEINGIISIGNKQPINIANFEFETFCQPLTEDFTIMCHEICQTCFGPFFDNCLSCKSGFRRFLYDGQCLCDPGTFQIQEFEICQTFDDKFKNLNIIEEELSCKLEGYDKCNDSIICSFGYFKYQGSYCIQCPYYKELNSEIKILCVNCLIDPDEFSNSLTCTYDAFLLNLRGYTFDIVLRSEDNKQPFTIQQFKDNHQLKLIQNKLYNNLQSCRRGYYFDNEECFQCSQGCIECQNSFRCSQCEEGYCLDKNNVCAKCQNCLKCELKNEQFNCLLCPQKYYLKNKQCISCGLYCADCRANGYCNYCIDSQKYFISLDGINCLVCNIPNCKYCFQEYEINQQIQYSSHTLYLEFYIKQNQSRDQRIQCAICYEGYILDLNTGNCIKQFNQDSNNCILGYYDKLMNKISCMILMMPLNQCPYYMRNCHFCSMIQCFKCQQGYYVDIQSMSCSKCPIQCKNCIYQNKKLMDNWKIEILLRTDKIFYYKFDILSKNQDDYEIQCTSCPPNYILYNSNCIEGCNDECLKCEVIEGQAKCVECKPFNNKIVKSIDSNGQCLRCQQNCELCAEKSAENLQEVNKFFIQKQENQVYTRSCYKPLPSINGKKNFINQLSIIDCEKYNKCKRKGVFTWNIYCDFQQFQEILKKSGFFQDGHYYFKDFFEKDILSQVDILNMWMNEYVIEQIDIILNIFSGNNNNSCKPQEQTKILIKIHSKFIYNLFFFKGVNLKISGQQQNVLLEDFIFEISGFQQIQFENLNFTRNQINIIDTLTNSITFINCSFGNDSPMQTLNPYNLNLINVTIQITSINEDGFFLFHLKNDNLNQQDIKIMINGLRIINSKFINTKFISIIDEIGLKVNCQINNLQIIETEFENSSLFTSSQSSGLKNIFFGNLTVTVLNIETLNLKNSKLFYMPNVFQLSINCVKIKNLKLQVNSYFFLSNQLNCKDFQIQVVEIDQSYLFSNKVPLLYQTSFNNLININVNSITIQNVIYNQEKSIIEIITYNNFKVIVNLNEFRIKQASSIQIAKNFLSQEISSIHISCSQCYLNKIEIYRKYGIPEISIIDSELIIISNSFFTQNEKSAQDLIDGCQNKGQNSFPHFIYIGKYEKIKFDNLTIVQAISFNYPFMILVGVEIMQKQIEESIEIINSIFENNKLITSKSNSPTSIIQINTKQKCLINLTNLTFQDNHLNMEIQDLITLSSSTFLIDTQLGMILMNNCLFQQNIVTNSTDSPLYVKAQVVQIIDSQFIKNNIINFQNLFDRMQLNSIGNRVDNYDLQQSIQVLSNGGSGYLLTNQLSLKNCSVQESYSLYGGAFYINTFGDAQILIEDSNFIKTSSSLQSLASSNGGCFYIDAQVSKLTLLVRNSTFNQSFSRSKGGCFYIVPSKSFNFVHFESIKVINSFSTSSQFFEYSLQNLNSIISNVTFQNINIVSNEIVFNKFLSLLENLSSDEASTILNDDPIIKIKNGNVTLCNIYCQSDIKIFLASVDQGQIININQIHYKNGYIRTSPFLSINLKSGFQGLIKMFNIKIDNLQQYQEMSDTQICQENLSLNRLQQFCITPIVKMKNISLENNIVMIQQITLCQNQNLLFKSEKLKFSLILISDININHKIIIQEVFLNEIVCGNCQYGLIGLTNIGEHQQNNIILNGIIIQKSQCGITGCLTIINKNSRNYLKTNYLKNENRILQEQIYETLNLNFQVSISNSKFIQNMANYGGAVCVIDINILILQCQFHQNKAKVGGAIYSFSSQLQNFKTLIFSSFLVNNQAELAAEIYLENQMLQQTEKLNVIIQNNSTASKSYIFERPRSLAISINSGFIVLEKKIVLSTSTKVIEQALIKPYSLIGSNDRIQSLIFPSGYTMKDYYFFDIPTLTNIPYNLSFRIIGLNMLNQIQEQLNGSICTLDHKVINLTNQQEIEDFYAKLSINYITFNTSSLDFNLDNLIVNFNPYYDKEIVLRLFIQCDMIQIPIYDETLPYLIKNLITDYTLFVDIKTFPCQLGEYFNSTSKICIKCNSDQSQYQVELNATSCSIQDETKIKSVQSEKIELKPNFWRAYFYSTKIEECYYLLENCLGGWYPGDKSCSYGHIGALCEQCDLYNIRGDGHFSTSSPYKCSNCNQTQENILSILLISLWTLTSVLIFVNSTIDTIKQFIARSKFKLIFFGVSSLSKQSSTAVLIKVFTNYLQIIKTISTFQLKAPANFTYIFTSVGNPMEQVAYGLDCFLISISDISIIYFRVIWSFLMAISYVSIFFLFLAGAILLKYIKFNISMITTALIYIFIFLQPNLIQQLISLVSFRKLSDIAWIQGNVAYRYDATSHQFWMISFCIPILITFSLLIPQFMFYSLRSNRNHLEQIKTRETWGYLYNEYKLQAYYWEFIKIFQKELIIIFLAYYEDFIAIKASLVFLVIFVYSYISNAVSPYMTGELNRFDIQSTTICAVSIILGSSIYTAQNQNFIEIVYPFYIIIALINGWFLLKMIFFIFLAYFEKLNDKIDEVKEIISQKFPSYLLKYAKAKQLLESKRTKLLRIKLRFAMIKQYLIPKAQKILKIKNETEIYKKSISCSTFKVDQEIQTNDITINKFLNLPQQKSKIFLSQESQRPFQQDWID